MIGALIQLSTLAIASFGAYRAAKTVDALADFPQKIADYIGHEFVTLANENPLLGFLFRATIITTMAFFSILVLARWAKIRIPRFVNKLVVIAPLFIVSSALGYMSYIQLLKRSDKTYQIFGNVKSYEDAIFARKSSGISHSAEQKSNPNYLFEEMAKNYDVAVYDDMFNEVGNSAINSARKKETMPKNNKSYRLEDEQLLSPLMYAAYHGYNNAVSALCKREGLPIDDYISFSFKETCPKKDGSWKLFRVRKYETTWKVTAYDFASWKGYFSTQKIIKKWAEKRNSAYYFPLVKNTSNC